MVKGQELAVDDDFWEHVADEKSVEDAEQCQGHIENYVGTIKYPVGVIGPLEVHGEHANGVYVVPMGTHEGALLASYTRGAKAITAAGGASARIKTRSMTRAPVFIFADVVEASDFHRFCKLPATQEAIRKLVAEEIEFCNINYLRVFQTDRKVHLSLGMDTQDAVGQNMSTRAGEVVMEFMRTHYDKPISEMYVEGGFNAGKRVSVMHTLLGRGTSVVCDVVVPKEVVQKVLHTTPYRLQRFQKMHSRTNEFMGGISCTAHVANGLTAFYIANGQDAAAVAESQAAVTHFDVHMGPDAKDANDCDLYASITLNSLMLATVGGGTQLPSFKAARSMMDVKSSSELAEICAATALAGELSFYAAMESGEFTDAHWNMTHK